MSSPLSVPAQLRRFGVLGALLFGGCTSDRALPGSADDSRRATHDAGIAGTHAEGSDAGYVPELPGIPMTFDVNPGRDTFINLRTASVVASGERNALSWDLVFSGYFVQSNSGPSGPGAGAVFGPSQDLDLLFDAPPEVPFRSDTATGALSRWFAYGTDRIYSRGHVYGVTDGDQLWKLQFVSYYHEADGERTSAIYRLRFQELTADGPGELMDLDSVDASAEGVGSGSDSKAACVNLSTAELRSLSDAEARADRQWHICLRRTQAFVNGGYSGPGSVKAVDLDVESVETAEQLERLTAAQMLEHFDSADYAALTASDLVYQSDDVVRSAFGDAWVERPGPDAVPVPNVAWLVRAADGEHHFGVLFTGLLGPSAEAPGEVSLRVKTFTQ